MSIITLLACIALAISGTAVAQTTSPASQPLRGELQHHTFDQSKIYPGTTREFWVYIPAEYDPAKPACLFVDQDSVQFNAPAVIDQLLEQKKIPAMIGVFVAPGRVKAVLPDAIDRFNRSYEYDTLSDEYARFLIDELLPAV